MESETRIRALAILLDCEDDEIEPTKHDEKILQVGNGKYPNEYMVLTDDEADDVWDEQLESYIEECILGELPEHLRIYFDNDSWKKDARKDGRGHSISSYNGQEEEVDVDGKTLYVYRIN